ncbi:MAG: DNA polymerase Y family protein [Candidatus Saccharimonadales bacterium]
MTDLQLNNIDPLVMHVDLNSCYAIIEQQANRLIRYKPVGVAAYDSPGGFIIASSYEAKRLGIGLMRVREAREITKDIIILTPDPEKYFDAHRRFKAVLERYTSDVTPKSVDEFVVNFQGSRAVQEGRSLVDIGRQIKRDIRQSLGEYVTVNIGIAPNRFLAKLAAGMDKPDGLDVVTAADIHNLYGQLDLIDLPGINYRYKARLNLANIFTPLDFLEAPMFKLKKEIFKSIVGYYWYLRLRGYEVDSAKFGMKSFGNDYAVGDKTSDPEKISRLLMKLCEKTGRRIRKHDYQAQGVFLGMGFENGSWWGKSKRSKTMLYSTQDIYLAIMRLFRSAEIPARLTHINIAVFDVVPATPVQLGLFDGTRLDTRSLAVASDKINNRYGEFTVVPATMANMQDIIIKRVPFGSVRDI